MLIAFVPVLVMILGLLLWLLASNPVVKDIGRICFIIGTFFTVSALSGHTVRLLDGR